MHAISLRFLIVGASLAGVLFAQDPVEATDKAKAEAIANLNASDATKSMLTRMVGVSRTFEMRVPMDRFFEDDGEGDVSATTVSPDPIKKPQDSNALSAKPVPMLGDVPVIGSLFTPPGGRLSPRETWFVRYLRSAAGPEVLISFEETRIRRYDAETSRVSLRREAVIRGPDASKAKLEAALDRLAASRGKSVLVSLVLATREVAAGEAGTTAENVDSLDETAFEAAIAALKAGKYPKLSVISAPQLITNHGSMASISIGDTVSYVKEYRLTVVGDGSTIADPVVDTVTEGLLFDIVPCLEDDGKSATVRLGVEIKRVARPIPSYVAKVGDAELKTELPAAATQSFRATLVAPMDGGGVRIHGLRWTDPATRKDVVAEIYLSVARVEQHNEHATSPPGAVGERVFTGSDGGEGIVVVDMRDRKDFTGAKSGAKLDAVADGKVVGVWEVQHSAGGLLVLKRVEGLPLGPTHQLRAR